MAADLLVPVLGGGLILQVHSLENGVAAELFADIQHRLLGPMLPLLPFLPRLRGGLPTGYPYK